MPYSSLRNFVEALESEGELLRIREFVSPYLEISEITDRISKAGGKALLFENTGTAFPLLINSMGSEKRMCMALQVKSLEEIGMRLQEIAGQVMAPKDSFLSKLAMLPTLAGVASWMPRRISGLGKCQEVVVKDPDLTSLPILTCWPFDGGPFITLPAVHTVHPVSGQRNLGMYRMQVLGKKETGMHWHLHKGSAAHYQEYRKLGMKMPVAVALGGDPVYTYAATAPLPENVDEYLLAGFLRSKGVNMVRCLTSDLEVPADADIIIEGYIDPAEELILEGPFGDHTGFYSLADFYPRFHVTCITHRKDAVYPATIVGIPPQEDAWIGKATERIFLTPIRLSMLPEIVDMAMPAEGVFHNIVLVKIHKTFPGQAVKVMNSLWGAGQMMFNKVLVVVDEEVNLSDMQQVLKAVTEHVHPELDIVITPGPVDVLDHSSNRFALGSKLGIDATRKLPQEGERKGYVAPGLPLADFGLNEEFILDDELIKEGFPILFVFINKKVRGQVRELHERLVMINSCIGLQWILYVDMAARGMGLSDRVWMIANNIDPSRDCIRGNYPGPIGIDGTVKFQELDDFKREWPNVIIMNQEVIDAIDKKWELLGIGPFLPSPSLRYRQLVLNEGAVAVFSKNVRQ